MDVKLKIYFVNDAGDQFMGIGVYWLLLGIKEHGSIRKAAGSMQLSYVKALSMLKNLEKTFDRKILIRKKGGESREGATLTPTGEKLIQLYDEYQYKVKTYADFEFLDFREKFDLPD